MFSFLNSTALLAAAAALIPLIIHLFSKRRVQVVEFSSLKHLKAMQRRQVRRLKIRQILLLILRMLIILAVVLAFARPTLRSGAIGSHAAVSAVILFDNSASMNRYVADGNLYELARQRVLELVDSFGEADEVAVLPLDAGPAGDAATAFGSPAAARELLTELPCGAGQADLSAALDRAATLLESAASLNKEVYLVTDRQRGTLPDEPVAFGEKVRFCLLDLPLDSYENCGVVSVAFGGQLVIPGHDFEMTAVVKNYGGSDRRDLIVSLHLDGNRVAQTDASVEAGRETTVRFTRSVSRTGFHSGYVELSDDAFPGDNRYYFSFRIPDRFNLLLVQGDEAAPLLALALVPSESVNQYWSVKEVAPEDLAGVNFLEYDVIALVGAPSLEQTYLDRLEAFAARGRSLFFTYGGETDIEFFNRHYSDLTGVMYDQAARRDFTRAGYYTLGSVDLTHPVFSVFEYENNALPEVEFYSLPSLHTLDHGRTLMRYSGDRPALVEARYGEGRVLTITGPLSPRFTDLTGQAFFVPFISRVVEYLAADLSGYDLDLRVGQNVTRSIPLRGSIDMPLELTVPSGATFSIPPEEEEGRLVFRPSPTAQAGLYHTEYLGREIDRFALNVPPAEGNLQTVDPDQLATAVGAESFHRVPLEIEVASAVAELRFGRELWQLFLWIAAVLLAAEMLLARGSVEEAP